MELAFSMTVILLMIFGIMKVFKWTGADLAARRKAHDDVLVTPIERSYENIGDGPLRQIDPYFQTPISMNAIWDGK
jgi:hypothetical protein